MIEKIRGKVARVLDSRMVAINVGARQGVKVGMKFSIMDAEHGEIIDPDSGEPLGSLLRRKAQVKITVVSALFSVGQTFRQRNADNIFGAYFGMPQKGQYETLRTNEETWDDLDEDANTISIGDRVVQVIEDGEEDEDQ